ncbi:MAG TPA: hypothetical protein VGI99_13120 [Gemmataceae bacterium]|jgi:hypothetical protein
MKPADAKRLEVALEALRILMIGDDPFHRLINAHRKQEDAPADWTRGFDKVAEQQETYQFKEPADRMQAGSAYGVQAPARRPGDPVPEAERETSTVPATGKPIPVIIVGPKPLLVKLLDEPIVPGKEPGNTPGAGKKPPMPGRGGRENAVGSAAGIIGGVLTKQFAMVFGPLVAFGTILSQTNSGFSTFGKAIQLMGATLAPLVLPFFVLLSTALMTLSDYISGELLDSLKGLYEWMKKFGIPEAKKKVGEAADAIDTGVAAKNVIMHGESPQMADLPRMADSFLANVIPGGNAMVRNGRGVGDLADFAARQLGFESPQQALKPEGMAEKAGETLGVSGPGVSKPKMDLSKAFDENLKAVIRSVQMSIGPKAAYSGLGEVGKQAQLAALSQDPIDAKILQQMIKSVELLGILASNTKPDERGEQNFRAGVGGALAGIIPAPRS